MPGKYRKSESIDDRTAFSRLDKWLIVIFLLRVTGYFTLFPGNLATTQVAKILIRLGTTAICVGLYMVWRNRFDQLKFQYRHPAALAFYVLYLLLGMASLLWTGSVYYSGLQWFMVLETFVFAVISWHLYVLNRTNLNSDFHFTRLLGISIGWILLWFAIQSQMDPDLYMRTTHAGEVARLGGFIINPNELGMLAVLACALYYHTALEKGWNAGRLILLAIAVVVLLLTQSRSSLAAFGLVSILFLLKWKRHRLTLAAVVTGLFVAPYIVRTIIIKVGDLEEVLSFTGRLPFWRDLIMDAFPKEPWFGYGFMRISYTEKFESLHAYAAGMSHNTFIQVLMNLGLVGFAIMLAQMGATFKAIVGTPDASRKIAAWWMLLPLLVNSFTEFGIFGESNYGILFYQWVVLFFVVECHPVPQQIAIPKSIRNQGSHASPHDMAWLARLFGGLSSRWWLYDPDGQINLLPEDAGRRLIQPEAIAQNLSSRSDAVLFLASPLPEHFWLNIRIVVGLNFPVTGISWRLIYGPEGGIRWMFPAHSRRPEFLHLYNSQGFRPALFRAAMRVLFPLGLAPYVYKNKITVHWIDPDPEEINFWKGASIFAGTAGDQRKAVITALDSDGKRFYLKRPLTPAAELAIAKEAAALQQVHGKTSDYLKLPKATKSTIGWLQSGPDTPQSSADPFWRPAHTHALLELYTGQIVWEAISQSDWGASLQAQLAAIRLAPNWPETKMEALAREVVQLSQDLDLSEQLPLAPAHGDFTPWNMHAGTHQLFVFDWEFYREEAPLLFDFFHFHFQSGLLLLREPVAVILKRIQENSQQPLLRDLLRTTPVSINRLLQYYLLWIISYYLPRYAVQQPLNIQNHWLVAGWLESLKVLENEK